jgi:hypothetical protein
MMNHREAGTRIRFDWIIAALIVALFLFLGARTAHATERDDISQVGPHQPVLTFEKNENPQNIMVIYTKVDKNCDFKSASDRDGSPVFDFYWLMDHKKYKPVNSMIKSGIRERLSLDEAGRSERSTFSVKLNDLKELNADLADPKMTISATKSKGGDCDVAAQIKLGPSDHDRLVKLSTIYSEAEKTVLPPFRKVVSVTLIGKDAKSGAEVKRTYKAKM